MKLCRYGPRGQEKPGLVDADGRLRALPDVRDLTPDMLAPERLAALAALDPAALPLVDGDPRLGVPVAGVGTFVAIGLNYRDHAEEAGMKIPDEPVVFNKWVSCLSGPDDPIAIPPGAAKVDWEAELGLVIGTRASRIDPADALAHVAGYCVVHDVSERAWQLEHGPTWDKGKGFPTFGPVGPWLVTPDEVGDPQALGIWLEVNGRRVQDGNTGTMIFPVAEIVAYCSRFMTLEPGDVITTGTPPGVGMGQKPEPRFLKPGDVVELGIDRLGRQRQQVIAG